MTRPGSRAPRAGPTGTRASTGNPDRCGYGVSVNCWVLNSLCAGRANGLLARV